MTTTQDIRIIVNLPKDYPADVKDKWEGCTVEVLNGIDTKGALSCRLLDGEDKDRELWLMPTMLMEPVLTPMEPGTSGEW